MLVAFGAVLGRVGPKDLLIIGTFHIIGYSLNEVIVFYSLGMLDAGGSTTIHAYGAYYGLTVALIIAGKIKPISNARISYISNIFAFIGCLFLWVFWPSFNFGAAAQS
jgi:ammonium transporter Rh